MLTLYIEQLLIHEFELNLEKMLATVKDIYRLLHACNGSRAEKRSTPRLKQELREYCSHIGILGSPIYQTFLFVRQ